MLADLNMSQHWPLYVFVTGQLSQYFACRWAVFPINFSAHIWKHLSVTSTSWKWKMQEKSGEHEPAMKKISETFPLSWTQFGFIDKDGMQQNGDPFISLCTLMVPSCLKQFLKQQALEWRAGWFGSDGSGCLSKSALPSGLGKHITWKQPASDALASTRIPSIHNANIFYPIVELNLRKQLWLILSFLIFKIASLSMLGMAQC